MPLVIDNINQRIEQSRDLIDVLSPDGSDDDEMWQTGTVHFLLCLFKRLRQRGKEIPHDLVASRIIGRVQIQAWL